MTEIFVAIVSAVLGGVVAGFVTYKVSYPLGVKQGKQQLRHERSVTVLTELHQGLLRLRKLLRSHVEALPNEESDEPEEIEQQVAKLQTYFEENELVLDEDLRSSFRVIINETERRLWDFSLTISMVRISTEEEKQNEYYKAGVKQAMWIEETYSHLLHNFRENLKEVIGTEDPSER